MLADAAPSRGADFVAEVGDERTHARASPFPRAMERRRILRLMHPFLRAGAGERLHAYLVGGEFPRRTGIDARLTCSTFPQSTGEAELWGSSTPAMPSTVASTEAKSTSTSDTASFTPPICT